MERKLFKIFTGRQLTLVTITAIVAPSALYAAATFSPVAIVDPVSGVKSQVDSGHKLTVYDPIAGITNNPANFVRFSGSCSAGTGASYTPPAGKGLLIKGANFTQWAGTQGADNYTYLINSSGFVAGLDDPNTAAHEAASLGAGFYVSNGETVRITCNSTGSHVVSFTGVLSPSAHIPAIGTPDAIGQSISSAIRK